MDRPGGVHIQTSAHDRKGLNQPLTLKGWGALRVMNVTCPDNPPHFWGPDFCAADSQGALQQLPFKLSDAKKGGPPLSPWPALSAPALTSHAKKEHT